jgi:dipeptidase
MKQTIGRLTPFVVVVVIAAAHWAPVSVMADTESGDPRPDECTVVTVGKLASADGSVMTSHTCDSHRTRSWFDIVAPNKHKKGSTVIMVKRVKADSATAMPSYGHLPTGDIPQVEQTHGFINTAYPCMNVRLMLERCTTAREAIRLAGDLLEEYGWIDEGELLSVCDAREAWHLEIVGPGGGNVGAVWAAQRIPDGHVGVGANASRIRQIDLDDSDYFMASDNIYTVAQDSGWWDESRGPFEFCYAYDPTGRTSAAATRREWRVLSMVAPSLGLHPHSENFPFSVKPDSLVTLAKMVEIFQDYFEGTDYNFVKDLTWVNADGVTEISPLANPFMPYDMNKMLRINGGWGWRGERTIARWYTMYATITQSRESLPDEIGGVVWMAMDNVATSIYVPIYSGVTDVSEYYKTPGRVDGYTSDSAWWAFNRLGTLAAQRWGGMRHDVTAVWTPMQQELFGNQAAVEKKALELYEKKPKKAREYLTDYGIEWGDRVVERAWRLGDELWTKYDEKF